MDVLLAPFVVAAALLTLAGAQKVVDPRNAVGAMRALGLPASDAAVRAGSGVELVVGVTALFVGSPTPAVVVALSYLVFAAFVAAARRRGTMIGTCGCFGHEETPPSLIHVVVDVALAAVAIGWAIVADRAPIDAVADSPAAGLPLVGLCALGAWLLFAVMTQLPRTLAAARMVSQ